MIDSAIFIGAIIIAITQALKFLSPRITGIVTLVVAVIVGILVALVDKGVGLADISVAQGILIALAAIGAHTTLTSTSAKPIDMSKV